MAADKTFIVKDDGSQTTKVKGSYAQTISDQWIGIHDGVQYVAIFPRWAVKSIAIETAVEECCCTKPQAEGMTEKE